MRHQMPHVAPKLSHSTFWYCKCDSYSIGKKNPPWKHFGEDDAMLASCVEPASGQWMYKVPSVILLQLPAAVVSLSSLVWRDSIFPLWVMMESRFRLLLISCWQFWRCILFVGLMLCFVLIVSCWQFCIRPLYRHWLQKALICPGGKVSCVCVQTAHWERIWYCYVNGCITSSQADETTPPQVPPQEPSPPQAPQPEPELMLGPSDRESIAAEGRLMESVEHARDASLDASRAGLAGIDSLTRSRLDASDNESVSRT